VLRLTSSIDKPAGSSMQRLETKGTYKTARGAHHSNLMGGPWHNQAAKTPCPNCVGSSSWDGS
jgi:hypothetical protein